MHDCGDLADLDEYINVRGRVLQVRTEVYWLSHTRLSILEQLAVLKVGVEVYWQ